MSTDLDTELHVGLNTRANPYLVCFCDEQNQCLFCEKHDYYATDSLGGAIKKAGKKVGRGVKGVAQGTIGESVDEKAERTHAKRTNDSKSTQFKMWKCVTSRNPTSTGKFTKDEFERFERDFDQDHDTLKETSLEDFKKIPGIKTLAEYMFEGKNILGKKVTYDVAMAAMAKKLVFEKLECVKNWKHHKTATPGQWVHEYCFW